MELTVWRPFAGLESFDSQINQLFDQVLGQAWIGSRSASTGGYQAVDVLESKDS